MKPIDPDKAASYRKEWVKMAEMWEAEAVSRREKAKKDAKKYHATHIKAAKDAERDARHFRDLIRELDAEVEKHEKQGRLV